MAPHPRTLHSPSLAERVKRDKHGGHMIGAGMAMPLRLVVPTAPWPWLYEQRCNSGMAMYSDTDIFQNKFASKKAQVHRPDPSGALRIG